jgi:hypothetical protein
MIMMNFYRTNFLLYCLLQSLAWVAGQNSFSAPTSNEVIPVGKPFTFKWDVCNDSSQYENYHANSKLQADTPGPIDLKLLSSSSGSAFSLSAVLVQGISNTGSYIWTPSETSPTNYEYTLEIIDDTTGSVTVSDTFSLGDEAAQGLSSSTTSQASSTAIAQSSATNGVTTTPSTSSSPSSQSSSTSLVTSLTYYSTSSTDTLQSNSASPASLPKAKSHSLAIGLGVGIPVGLLIMVGLAFFAWRHRRQSEELKRLRARDQDKPNDSRVIDKNELDSNETARKPMLAAHESPVTDSTNLTPSEAPANPVHEIYTRPAELGT